MMRRGEQPWEREESRIEVTWPGWYLPSTPDR